MSDLSEPNWSLLPGNPVAFFGLSPGFDLRALKSAYGRLVRRYKPEKSPEEFQRIRTAFEALRRRFDATQGHSVPPPPFDVMPPRPKETPRLSQRLPVARPRDEPRRAEPLSIRDRYATHRSNTLETPQDYYEIACLADLIDDDDIGFAGWLLDGLRHFPDDPGLASLVSAYLATEEAAESADSLLVATSEAVPGDHFYDITRPLWERLIHAVDFGTFRKLLDLCEANLDGDPGEGYVAFSWWMLKRAVWEPDEGWFKAKVVDLESLGDLTRWDAQRDRDIVDHLMVYLNARHTIVTKRFVRKEMDRAVMTCTTSRHDVADRRMTEVQQSLALHDRELLREFPPDCQGVEPLVILWESLSADTASRLGLRASAVEDDQSECLRVFASELLSIGWRPGARLFAFWGYGILWLIKAVILFVGVIFALTLIGVAIVVITRDLGVALFAVPGLVGILYAMRWLWKLSSREQSESLATAHRRLYRYVWRPRIAAFLKVNPVPSGHLANALLAVTRQSHGRRRSDRAARIAECLANDIGLRLFSIARLFLK